MPRLIALFLSLVLIFESVGPQAYAAVSKARGLSGASFGKSIGRGKALRASAVTRINVINTALQVTINPGQTNSPPAQGDGAATVPQPIAAARDTNGADASQSLDPGRQYPAMSDLEASGGVVNPSRISSVNKLIQRAKSLFSRRSDEADLTGENLAQAGIQGPDGENKKIPEARLAASPSQAPPSETGLKPQKGDQPPAPSSGGQSVFAENPQSKKSVMWFLAGLLTAQIGIEILGAAMPLLMRERFGGFTAMAQIAVFSSIAGVFGKLLGGPVADKIGLKTTYTLSTVLRLLSVSTMILFLLGPAVFAGASAATGLTFLSTIGAWLAPIHQSPALMFKAVAGFYSFNAFVGGMSMTAEDALPARLLGNKRSVLEQFYALEHWLAEIIGVGGPKAGGWLIRSFGFIPALIVYPVVFIAALFMFIFGMKVPEAGKIKSQETTPVKTLSEAKPKRGIFTLVFRNPVLRTAYFAFIAFMLLNPVLYQILGPAFGIHMSGGNSHVAADIGTYITALYSLGGLFGALFMWRESKLIAAAQKDIPEPAVEQSAKLQRARKFLGGLRKKLDSFILKAYLGKWLDSARKPDGRITEESEKQILTKSTLLWMRLAALTLIGFPALLLPVPYAAYLAMIPFGAAQVIAYKKLRALAMSEVEPHEIVKVSAFMGASLSAVIALVLNAVGRLFDVFPGIWPFLYLNGAIAALAGLYLWLTYSIKRHTSSATSSN